ncbi:hypothetical protein AAFF_G00128550 [Aldrovandia affinis]|uniref:Uncharacterized protein n=1 Tax=Aldrovandia affinis TaxID=143900 RepID=A0AAD7T174_9TELE|nr:hypothetical protein AAFF_G00128550 [Aldrovandia affinis]
MWTAVQPQSGIADPSAITPPCFPILSYLRSAVMRYTASVPEERGSQDTGELQRGETVNRRRVMAAVLYPQKQAPVVISNLNRNPTDSLTQQNKWK